MLSEIRGNVFIVTGGAMGLGRGFTEELLKEGGKVTVADINEDEGLKTVLDFKSRYGKERIHFVTLDVTDAKQFKAAFDATEAFFKAKVHGLVNNAGINHTQGWRKCMDIDIIGVMIGTEEAESRMSIENGGSGGIIINTASVAGLLPASVPEITCYHVAKHGVVALTKSQGRREIYAATGIRYVCICPWFTETNILTHDPEMFNKVKDAIGDSNIMTVDKVSGAFVNLIKDGYNGSAIVIMPKMEPFYWPFLAEVAIFAWLCLGSFVCTKLLRIRVFGPWHQLAYFVITILFLNYLFRMLLGFVF